MEKIKDCQLVYCDVSALGIAVAHLASLPCILFENFLWDWVYEDFLLKEQMFDTPISNLQEHYAQAGLHIQSEPVCSRIEDMPLVPPVSRKPRVNRPGVRSTKHSRGPVHDTVFQEVVIPMPCHFIINSSSYRKCVSSLLVGFPPIVKGNLHFLPFESDFFHPD